MTGIGQYLDEIKDEINERKYITDGTKLRSGLLDIFAQQFDIDFPKAISETKKRIQLRDAIDAYRQTGTEDALLRIFRLIGWEVKIDHVWTIYDGAETNIPLTTGQFIFGKEVFDTTTGKFFVDLYDDFGNTYQKVPYYGENYPDGINGQVIKTPYIRIVINQSDYSDYVSDYTDPETGVKYTYTNTEQFGIITNAIEYFLNEGRPANVAILDMLTFVNLLPETVPVPTDICVPVPCVNPGEYNGEFVYNSGMDIGRFGEVYETLKYGPDAPVYIDPTPPDVEFVRSYPIGSSGAQMHIQTRAGKSFIEVTGSDAADVIEIQVTNTKRLELNNIATYFVLQTLTGNTSYPPIELVGFTAVRLYFPTTTVGETTIKVTESS